MSIFRKTIMAAVLLLTGLSLAAPAPAALDAVGLPVDPHGYPWYYQDGSGLRLQLCLDDNGMCIFGPVDPANPDSVALQVGDESFWWMAETSSRPLVDGGKALLTLALEGAFGGVGVVRDGEQIAFGRIRVRVDVPEAGNYRIVHPFGEIDFPGVTVADGINLTEDIGAIDFLNPALGFRGALASRIGPFLTWPDYDNPVANPTLRVPVLDAQGVPTGEFLQYVGDPAVPHVVTGGTNGNVFRIQREVGGVWTTLSETDLFAVMGKVLPAGAIQPAAHVFPNAPPQNLFAVGPVNRSGSTGGITAMQPEGVRTGTELPGYPVGFPLWYQERLRVENPPGTFVDEGGLRLTLCPAADPMCISPPVDPANPESVRLGVGDETFWWSAEAFINDRTGDVQNLPPGLDGLLVLSLEGAFGGTGDVADGNQIAFGRVRIRVDVPAPGRYTITHPYGVEVFEDVTVADGINLTRDIGIIDPDNPDGGFVGALFSDIGPRFLTWPDFTDMTVPGNGVLQRPLDPNDPASPTVQYVGDPALPHAVTGSPDGNNFFRIQGPGGLDVRTYLFVVTGKVYDPATFQLIPNPLAPIARDEAATVESGAPVTIDILANDVIEGDPVVPAATTVEILPAGEVNGPFDGTVELNADKTVTYRSNPGFAGTDTFAYQIRVNGLVSNTATVTIDVRPVETVALTRAQLDLRRLEWNIAGTDTIPGTTITLHAGPTPGGPVIGTALTDDRGRWQFRGRVTRNPGVSSISLVTSGGKQLLNQPIRIR